MIQIDFTTKNTVHKYVVDEFGTKRLFDENGKLHSYDGLPAFVHSDGIKGWYNHGFPILFYSPSKFYSWFTKELK